VHGGHSYYVKETEVFSLDRVFAHTSILFCTADMFSCPLLAPFRHKHSIPDSHILALSKPPPPIADFMSYLKSASFPSSNLNNRFAMPSPQPSVQLVTYKYEIEK